MTILREEILRDREAGTPGNWALLRGYFIAAADREFRICRMFFYSKPSGVENANARRIARVPALESAYLNALDEIAALVRDIDSLKGSETEQLNRAEWAEQRIAELEAALRSIIDRDDFADGDYMSKDLNAAISVARATLKGGAE